MSDRITFAAEVKAEGRRLKGSVVLKGSRTFRDGEWVEVDPKALMKADASNVIATIDHDPARAVGRTTNQTLSLKRTEDGIEFETAELPNTTYANDALELARGGYFGGSSFSIEGIRSKFSTDPESGLRVRTINSIKRLGDVAVVMDPAFTSSMAAAFSKETDVTAEATEPVEEQKAPPAPPAAPAEPVAKFSNESDTDWFSIARRLPTEQIENALDSIMVESKGSPNPVQMEQYKAFGKVYDERKQADADAKARHEQFLFAHKARKGEFVKAPETELFASGEYKEAFTRYLKSGDSHNMAQFAQSISGTGAEGGYTVPEEFRNKIVETQAAYGGIQQHADLLETSDGRPIPWPTNNDTANSGAVATEGSAVGSGGADLVFGEISLGAFSVAATGTSNAPLKVSWELLQDSAIDLEGFIAKKLGERLGRKAASLYANGVGTTEPFGLLAKTPDTMTATLMLAALTEHMFQVNEAYRESGNCRWIMADAVLSVVYNSVDKNGRPLFIPAAESSGAGRPAGTLLGFPVQLDQAASTNVAFGDIQQGFVIRRVRDIQVVVDPYNNTAARQNAYHAWMRTDSAIQDSAAVSVSSYASVTANAVS